MADSEIIEIEAGGDVLLVCPSNTDGVKYALTVLD